MSAGMNEGVKDLGRETRTSHLHLVWICTASSLELERRMDITSIFGYNQRFKMKGEVQGQWDGKEWVADSPYDR
jgi:hypothetical protein